MKKNKTRKQTKQKRKNPRSTHDFAFCVPTHVCYFQSETNLTRERRVYSLTRQRWNKIEPAFLTPPQPQLQTPPPSSSSLCYHLKHPIFFFFTCLFFFISVSLHPSPTPSQPTAPPALILLLTSLPLRPQLVAVRLLLPLNTETSLILHPLLLFL